MFYVVRSAHTETREATMDRLQGAAIHSTWSWPIMYLFCTLHSLLDLRSTGMFHS
ncbi:hypothetical protein BDV41DRAFT_517624 [Aspergillus transmontanensis]|uniref:Uncharacterized protein n=1 Tax=Aspergillus transmontanensis TaxID=1034304 RepID=A0A5N6WGE8_9EURO|nr:hypothetical protein BDV41DRAFT_517624 [Aspergillus transmontanensis]